MSSHILCNLDIDYAWALWPQSYAPSVHVKRVNKKWARILCLLPKVDTTANTWEANIHTPSLSPVVWGVPPEHAHLFGMSAEVILHANSKHTSHQLEHELGVALPGSTTPSNVEELSACIASLNAPWVAKHPFGVGGRERMLGYAGVLEPKVKRWAERQYMQTTHLILEPWITRTHEWSLHANIDADGSWTWLGVCAILSDATGTPRGHTRADPSDERYTPTLAQNACIQALATRGYCGPVSIDAFEGLNDAGVLIRRPITEINARHTFGRMALTLQEHFLPKACVWAWKHPTKKEPAYDMTKLSPLPATGLMSAETPQVYRLPAHADPHGLSGTVVYVAQTKALLDKLMSDLKVKETWA